MSDSIRNTTGCLTSQYYDAFIFRPNYNRAKPPYIYKANTNTSPLLGGARNSGVRAYWNRKTNHKPRINIYISLENNHNYAVYRSGVTGEGGGAPDSG